MTAIYYPDRIGISPNGQFTLTARSPHNGTITYRARQRAKGKAFGKTSPLDEFASKYREHQSDFCYQLLDTATKDVLWERWQEGDEESPHDVVVSDEGWSILRTHGYCPEIICISPFGEEVLRVRIVGRGRPIPPAPTSSQTGLVLNWTAQHLTSSTAGDYWTQSSWRYFLQYGGRPFFAWRTWWGQRLVIALDRPSVLLDLELCDPGLASAMAMEERRGAEHLLSELMPKVSEVRQLLTLIANEDFSEHPLHIQLQWLKSAINLVGIHRIGRCIPLLRPWEELDWRAFSTGTTALGKGWWLEVQHLRPLLHHVLRLLGAKPAGFSTYHFRATDGDRLPMPEQLEDRSDRISELRDDMTAQQVLSLLGSPNFISRTSRQDGKIYRWPEQWDYDLQLPDGWSTLRITWEDEGKRSQIGRIDQAPSTWMRTGERDQDLLGF